MLLINNLRFMTPPKSFEDFNNMFKAIDPESYSLTYIATLVFDRVAREYNPTRTTEVNAWFNGNWYLLHRQQRQSESFLDEDEDSDSVGDIID